MEKWYSSVVVLMLNDTKEPKEWKRLHVRSARGLNCKHIFSGVGDEFAAETFWNVTGTEGI